MDTPQGFGEIRRQGSPHCAGQRKVPEEQSGSGPCRKVAHHSVCISPYSPDLSLIERLWKFVEGELCMKYYDDFTVLCDRIDQIIVNTSTNNQDKISKFIGTEVQFFDDLKQTIPRPL